MAIKKWEILKSEYLFKRPWLTVKKDALRLPNGTIHDEFYVLEYPEWINVIAEDTEGNLILERQYRHGLKEISTEICAGVVEKGEDVLTAAQRELKEETGYEGGEWTKLMTIAPNPGSMNNLCHCFLAKGVRQTGSQQLDKTEDIEFFTLPKDQVYDLLCRGEFHQALMVAPLWKYFATRI